MNGHTPDLTTVRNARQRVAGRIRRLRSRLSRSAMGARCRKLEDDLATTSIRLFEAENRVRELRDRMARADEDDRALRALQTCAILESENRVKEDEVSTRTAELGAVTRKLRAAEKMIQCMERRAEDTRRNYMHESRRLQQELAEAKAARTRLEEGVLPALRKPLDAEAIDRVDAAARRIEDTLRGSRMADLAASIVHDVDDDSSNRLGSLIMELAQSWSSEQAQLLDEIGTLNRNVRRIVRSVQSASAMSTSTMHTR